MMLKQFPITSLIAAIQNRVKTGTGMRCLDHVEQDEESPFFYVEFRQSLPGNSKTMYVMDYIVFVHAITEEAESSVPVYKYIEALQEAMTEDVVVPSPYNLVFQTDNGVQSIYREETGELHAIVSYTFRISYGFKCKI